MPRRYHSAASRKASEASKYDAGFRLMQGSGFYLFSAAGTQGFDEVARGVAGACS